MAALDDLRPGYWPVRRTAGDVDPVTPMSLEWKIGGSPVTVVITEVIAQVRERSDRGSTEVLSRTTNVVSGTVFTVGGDEIPNTPGRWWHDVQVIGTADGDPFKLTMMEGPFVIRRDVSEAAP